MVGSMTDHATPPAAPTKSPQGAPKQAKGISENQRCHYVPQFLLRHFVPQDEQFGRVPVLDKKTGEVTLRSPKDICQATNLYKTRPLDANREPTGSASFWAEKTLSKLENKVAPVIEKIIQQTQLGNSPSLREDERKCVLSFRSTLSIRSLPYLLVSSAFLGEWKVCEACRALLAGNNSGPIPQEVLAYMKSHMVGDVVLTEKATKKMPSHSLRILRVSSPDMHLVTGDIPIVLLRDNHGLGSWLPVTPKIAISFTNRGKDCVFSPSWDRVLTMNRYVYDLGNETIVQSQDHADEIIQTRESRIQFWERRMLCASIKS